MHKGFRQEEVSGRRLITEDDSGNFTENFTESLTDKELEVIKLIIENRGLTSTEMATRLGVTRQTIASRVRALKEKNIIRREGSDTKGYWEIIRKP
jgi:ATP-dependent DNA helicase RecG